MGANQCVISADMGEWDYIDDPSTIGTEQQLATLQTVCLGLPLMYEQHSSNFCNFDVSTTEITLKMTNKNPHIAFFSDFYLHLKTRVIMRRITESFHSCPTFELRNHYFGLFIEIEIQSTHTPITIRYTYTSANKVQ